VSPVGLQVVRGLNLRVTCRVAQAYGLVSVAGTCVLLAERRAFGVGRVWLFDIQGLITLLLGGLLALITLFSSYSHVHIPFLGTVAINQQVGVLLLAALVPALVGDAELATRCRLRAERDRVRAAEDRTRAADEAAEERILASEERDRADQERERAARRAQRQGECNLVQLRHQLDPSALNARRVRDLISLLEEYGGMA
jgi:hypothetical protein